MVAASAALLLMLAACNSQEADSEASQAASSDGATAAEPATTATFTGYPDTLPSEFFSFDLDEEEDDWLFRNGEVLGIRPFQITLESHDDFERLVVEFTQDYGGSASGGIQLYVSSTDDPRHDGSSEPISIDGEFVLAVSLPGSGPLRDSMLPEIDYLAEGLIREVVYDSYESGGSLYVGLSHSETEYRFSEASDPLRLYVDVRAA